MLIYNAHLQCDRSYLKPRLFFRNIVPFGLFLFPHSLFKSECRLSAESHQDIHVLHLCLSNPPSSYATALMGPYGTHMGPIRAHKGPYGPIWPRNIRNLLRWGAGETQAFSAISSVVNGHMPCICRQAQSRASCSVCGGPCLTNALTLKSEICFQNHKFTLKKEGLFFSL